MTMYLVSGMGLRTGCVLLMKQSILSHPYHLSVIRKLCFIINISTVCYFVLFLDRLCSDVDIKFVFVSLLTTHKIWNCIMDIFCLAVDYQRLFLTNCSSAENNPKLSATFNKTRGTPVTYLHTVIRDFLYLIRWAQAVNKYVRCWFWKASLVFLGICLLTFLCQLCFLLIVYHCYYFAMMWRNQRLQTWDLVSAPQWHPLGKTRTRY